MPGRRAAPIQVTSSWWKGKGFALPLVPSGWLWNDCIRMCRMLQASYYQKGKRAHCISGMFSANLHRTTNLSIADNNLVSHIAPWLKQKAPQMRGLSPSALLLGSEWCCVTGKLNAILLERIIKKCLEKSDGWLCSLRNLTHQFDLFKGQIYAWLLEHLEGKKKKKKGRQVKNSPLHFIWATVFIVSVVTSAEISFTPFSFFQSFGNQESLTVFQMVLCPQCDGEHTLSRGDA